jgi:hypothetical protein
MLPTYYEYKVYRKGVYLGMIPDVTSEFSFSQEINSPGVQITVTTGVKVDRSDESPNFLGSEDGLILTAEDGTLLTTQRQEDVIGNDNDQIIIRCGNALKVIEYNDYWPNGHQVFSGYIERIDASFGNQTGSEETSILAYSDGEDLKNYRIPGTVAEAVMLTQTTATDSIAITNTPFNNTKFGASITTGSNINNISSVDFYLFTAVALDFKVCIFNTANEYFSGVTPLGSCTINFPAHSSFPAPATFTFSTPVAVQPLTGYFITIEVLTFTATTQAFIFHNPSSNLFPGTYYYTAPSNPTVWTPVSTIAGAPNDVYIVVRTSYLTTKRSFRSVDPMYMVSSTIPIYNAAGGSITLGTIQSTGLSVNYDFILATQLDAIQVASKMAPASWYWYVDVGSSQLNCKQTSTTADIVLIKGVHIDSLRLSMTTENIVNDFLFTGGDKGSGINLFKEYTDYNSQQDNRPRLDSQADNRVVDDTAADAIGDSFIAANKDMQYQTMVSVLANTMDISLIKPGMTVGFAGCGNLVDNVIIQIVRLDKSPVRALLTLGVLPTRTNIRLQQAINDISDIQTIDNPDTAS